MIRRLLNRLWQWSRAPLFSPTGLLFRAALVTGVFLVFHLAGWREYTSILCGTSPTGNLADRHIQFLGGLYVLFYFATIILVPILVLAAGLLSLLAWGRGRRVKKATQLAPGNTGS